MSFIKNDAVKPDLEQLSTFFLEPCLVLVLFEVFVSQVSDNLSGWKISENLIVAGNPATLLVIILGSSFKRNVLTGFPVP